MKKLYVCDWNGTIFKYPTDEQQNKKIAYAVLDSCMLNAFGKPVPNPFKILKLLNLKKAKKLLEQRLADYKVGRALLAEIYEPFNEYVIKGTSVEFIERVIDKFAAESASLVDRKLLIPLKKAMYEGHETGILSTSYDYAIRKILDENGFDDMFEKIVSNQLMEKDGKAIKLTLDIYGKKASVLKEEFLSAEFNEHNVWYFGDSDDDAPIAELLPAGHFIVPFFATDSFKQTMASKHKAFVPKSETELRNYMIKSWY